MTISLEVLEAEVLKLPLAQRSLLLDRLVASLDADAAIEQAWMREAQRRDEELDSGAVEALDFDAAISQLRADLR